MKKETMWKGENGKFYYGWWVVLAVSILCIFSYCGVITLASTFMLPVTEELGFTVGQFSIQTAIGAIAGMIALALFTKYFTQKSLKKVVIIALIAGIIGFIGFATAQSLTQIYIFAVFLGICFALGSMTPSQILINNWFGEKYRAKAMSIFLAIFTIGPSALIVATNLVIVSAGWRTAYYMLAAGLVVCILIVAFVVKWSPEAKGIKRIGDLTSEESEALANADLPGITFKEAKKKPAAWLCILSATFFTIGSSAILAHNIPTLVMGGFSQTFAASAISITTLLMVISCVIIGAFVDKKGVFAGVVLTGICLVVAFVGLAITNIVPTAGMLMYLGGYLIGCMMINLVSPLFMGYVFGQKDISSFLGWNNIAVSLGGVFGGTIVGLMLDATGTYTAPWLVMCAFAVVGVLIRIYYSKHKLY